MAMLENLSTETVLEILQHVESARDLAALSMQNRRFRAIIDMPTRRRFHCIRVRDKNLDECYKLLLEILQKPSLGSLVREVEVNRVGRWTFTNGDPCERGSQVEGGDVSLLRKKIRMAGFSCQREENIMIGILKERMSGWKLSESTHLFPTDFGAIVGMLLLASCPSIAKLELGDIAFPIEGFLTRANAKKTTAKALRNLREVRLIGLNNTMDDDDAFYHDYDLTKMLKFFHRLPAIEKISVETIKIGANGLFKLSPGRSNLRKIHICHSNLNSRYLARVIGHCKELEEFKYTIGQRCTLYPASIKPKTLGKALWSHRSTLQVLDLDLDNHISYGYGPCDEFENERYDFSDALLTPQPSDDELNKNLDLDCIAQNTFRIPGQDKYGKTIGTFEGFTVLTRLSIGVKLLLGPVEYNRRSSYRKTPLPFRLIDSLPRKIEYLRLRGYRAKENEMYTSYVEELMNCQEECFPLLKEIHGVERYILGVKTPESLEFYDTSYQPRDS
ncbi:uncharacterized protein PADG_05101 [Paracoccidioides brasiliensis Pb18]|uniref:F-box domain-containing protein n=1 Tax=Paracoccidioides brasiliensis (strain Pb18) TaxID=502780 RepID=C1GCW5_PARBD|nr:uncharacterized protein PADG_05101 [Paracoccidioides brasiliensis Pb18]EEH49022.2 hypothetical protein PADG_05101 [Paracoccidioides brasiliensis Pb18]